MILIDFNCVKKKKHFECPYPAFLRDLRKAPFRSRSKRHSWEPKFVKPLLLLRGGITKQTPTMTSIVLSRAPSMTEVCLAFQNLQLGA